MARPMKILALADGFGDSVASPSWYPDYHKWPELITLMTRSCELTNLARYGAGNEYMIDCLKNHYHQADLVLIQWAIPDRLDLLLAHDAGMRDFWQREIASDSTYHDNTISTGQYSWWLSSSSTQASVQEYHKKYITKQQHQTRSRVWIEYAHRLLGSKQHGFMLTSDSEYLMDLDVDTDIWIWHRPWRGMHDWRYHSRFASLDLDLVQPIPLIQFDFITRFIMPRFDLPWRSPREIAAVESMLLRKYNQYKDKRFL